MKFKVYHSRGITPQYGNPIEMEAPYLEDAVAEAERLTGGIVHDASAFIPELGQWIAVDVWRRR